MKHLALLGALLYLACGYPLRRQTCAGGLLNYSPMAPITGFNLDSIKQVVNKMRILGTAMVELTNQISTCSTQNPHHPCYSSVQSSFLDDENATERIVNSYTLLVNVSGLLNDSIKYDNEYNGGAFAPCLEQILQQLVDIINGLSSMVNESGSQHVDSNGIIQSFDAETAQQCIQLKLKSDGQLKGELRQSCRCLGIVTSPQDECANIIEVKLGLNVAYQDVQSLLASTMQLE